MPRTGLPSDAVNDNVDQPPISEPIRGSSTYLWLVVSLFFSLLILPLLEGLRVGRTLSVLGLTATFLLSAIATQARVRVLSMALMVVALPAAWATLFVDWTSIFVAHCLLGSLFFWMAGGVILASTLRTRTVTVDSVYRAISAYLLFGLAWALTYWAIFTISPDAFSLPARNGDAVTIATSNDFSQFVYYSFVTMATLGYGDMTPLARTTRTLSWVQTVTGQFYVAIVIAWLVSYLPRPGSRDA